MLICLKQTRSRVYKSGRNLVAVAVLAGFGAVSRAQTVVPAFVGTASESFESFPRQATQLFVPSPTSVFSGTATLTVTGAPTAVQAIAIYEGPAGPDSFGPYQPSDGTQYAVTQDFSDSMNFTFNQTATRFGGYFGDTPIILTFRNASSVIVGTYSTTPASVGGVLAFVGYQPALPFVSVHIAPSQPDLIVLDRLQVTTPEPTTSALLGTVACALLKRRRRAS